MYEFLGYRVGDVMTSRPVVIGRQTSLAEVEVLFEKHDFNGLPVVESGDRLVGMLTKLDVLKAFAFSPQSVVPPYAEIMRQPAERFMTVDPVTAGPDTPLTRVLQTMIETRWKSLPVVEEKRLVGVVAREDILRALRLAVSGNSAVEAAPVR